MNNTSIIHCSEICETRLLSITLEEHPCNSCTLLLDNLLCCSCVELLCNTCSPNSSLLGVLNSFLRCVRPLCHCSCPPFSAGHVEISQVCRCWCPPFSAGHVAFLFICLPGLSLVASALFRWPCSVSMHLSPRSVAVGVLPFPLAM